MHLTPLRPIDISFVGTIDHSMEVEISALQGLGTAVETVAKSFKVSHLIAGSAGVLPPEVSRHIAGEPLETTLQNHFEKVRIAVLFAKSSVTQPQLVLSAVNAGCYIIIDEELAQLNKWLTPNTYGVLSPEIGLISNISNYITDSFTDLFMSVELAARGQVGMSLKKFEEVRDVFASLDGANQFVELQKERLKKGL